MYVTSFTPCKETLPVAEGCAEYLSKELGLPPATSVLDELPDGDPSTSGQQLRRCLAGGVAFHTANLTRDERQAVEIGFRERSGPIRALAATTTVAAGINTPASTVILAEQEFLAEGENTPFSMAEYKNMAGRAGRVGYHETGRSIILASNHWQVDSLYNRYVAGTAEPLRSTFNEKDENTWLLRLLSQVSRVRKEDLVALLASTYGGYIASRHHADWNARTVARLAKLVTEMLALGLLDEEEGFVRLSLLGRACGNSSLAFWSAMRVVRSLKARGDGPLIAEELMILVQATSEMDAVRTPLSKRGAGEPQWPQKLSMDAGNSITRTLQMNATDNAEYQSRCKRSVILRRWIAGDPIQTIEKESTTNTFFFRIAAGHIRQIADATRFHLRSAHHIASILVVNAAPDMQQVEDLCRRLEMGLPSMALPLRDLPISLERGQYLAMSQASLVSVDKLGRQVNQSFLR